MPDPMEPFRTDHLFMLIGANLLPNYVAAKLLSKPTTTFWLLHSDGFEGEPSTKESAKRLERGLKKLRSESVIGFQGVFSVPIASADNQAIVRTIQSIIRDECIQESIGLHYTGGTKPMAVHVYRAIEQASINKQQRPIFSYLDPRKLALCVDGSGIQSMTVIPLLSDDQLRRKVQVELGDLLLLHGYSKPKQKEPPLRPEPLTATLATIHTHKDGIEQWKDWLYEGRRNTNGVLSSLPNPATYPALQPICDVLDKLCDSEATEQSVAALIGFEKLDSGFKWLLSEWLEEFTYRAIERCRIESSLLLHDVTHSLKPTALVGSKGHLELDAAAMIGYQLFAFSCIANDKPKGETKKHLFEAYVRTRQLGGDEARTALVCLVESGDILRQELEREWDAEGKIKVFDRNDLKDLPAAFEQWFRTASG